MKFKRLILLTSIAAFAAETEHARFTPKPVMDYANHQTALGVTAGASAFETDDLARTAFGKVNPYKLGVLPVLLVIENEGKDSIRTDQLRVEYVGPDREKVESTPAREVRMLGGVKTPKVGAAPSPFPFPRGKKGSPLGEWEIEGRAFSALMIPPGETASGFFYFQTGHRSGATLYVSGLGNARTGEELLYFELPLERVR